MEQHIKYFLNLNPFIMITFKQEFTFPEEAIQGFALFLGWQEKLTRQVEIVDQEETETQGRLTHFDNEEYDNPESFTELVARRAVEHSSTFTKSWAEKLKQDAINSQLEELRATIEPTLYAQIVQPVEEALTSEILHSA